MGSLGSHIAAVLIFWFVVSITVSFALSYWLHTTVVFGFIAVGLAGGAWSSYQAYRKYHGK
jgi:hypothetical protein